MGTWADRPGPKPGGERSVRLQKSIAMGVDAPVSKRVVRVAGLKGEGKPCVDVPGLSYKR